jgi:DNA-binding NtrC family response regulator
MEARFILVVDDEACAASYLSAVLASAGYASNSVCDGTAALQAIERRMPDLVVTDVQMPGMDGLELVRQIVERWEGLPCIVLTVVEDIETAVIAIRMGAVNYIPKPGSPQAILGAVETALRCRRPRPATAGGSSEIVGASRKMLEARHEIALAARSDVNVLITGSTGTGKELAARAIHRGSPGPDAPFVAINCAAVPEELLESIFFGHERGAFTGANRTARGLLDEADRGSLFLDEIESLKPFLQAKLLRVLDEGEVRPVGSARVHRVKVRTLAASNVPVAGLLESGALRSDLYFRLRGIEIHLPDLEERREDIPLLSAHFDDHPEAGLTQQAMDLLMAREWPGNVRELMYVIRNARCLAGEQAIDIEHLAPARGPGQNSPRSRSLHAVERDAILRALKECGGNRSRAARYLGIHRSTLRRKMRGHSIGF